MIGKYKNVPFVLYGEYPTYTIHIALPNKSKFIINERYEDVWTDIEDIGSMSSQLVGMGYMSTILLDDLKAATEYATDEFVHEFYGIYWATFVFNRCDGILDEVIEIIDQLRENDHEGIYETVYVGK